MLAIIAETRSVPPERVISPEKKQMCMAAIISRFVGADADVLNKH